MVSKAKGNAADPAFPGYAVLVGVGISRGFFGGRGGGIASFVAKMANRTPLMNRFNISIIVCVCGFFLYNTLNICIQGLLLMFISYALSVRDATLFTLFFYFHTIYFVQNCGCL